LRLQLNQGRGHHQKVAGDSNVQLLHDAQVTQILVSNASDGNVVDTDVLLTDQMQQKIQWPFKLTEQDLQIVSVVIRDDLRDCSCYVKWRGAVFGSLYCGLRVILVHQRFNPVFWNTCSSVTLAICLAFSRPWSRI